MSKSFDKLKSKRISSYLKNILLQDVDLFFDSYNYLLFFPCILLQFYIISYVSLNIIRILNELLY